MFSRLLLRSLVFHRQRTAIICLAAAVACALAIAMLQLAADARARLQRELRAFGANVALLPAGGEGVPAADVDRFAERVGSALRGCSPVLETIAYTRAPAASQRPVASGEGVPRLSGQPLGPVPGSDGGLRALDASEALRQHGGRSSAALPRLTTADPRERPGYEPGVPVKVIGVRWGAARTLFPYWWVAGQWPAAGAGGVCLIGARLAGQLGVIPGGRLAVALDGRRLDATVSGVVTAGDTADEECFVSLAEAQGLAGRAGGATLGLAAIEGDSGAVERIAAAATRGLPGLTAQPLRALSAAEGPVLARAGWVMAIAGGAVLILAALAILATSMAAAVERERDVALLKALGWGDRETLALFIAEAALAGLVGGALGAIVGWGAARYLARDLYGAELIARPGVLLLALLLGMVLAVLGAALPARRVLALDPARALRSE